MKPWILAALLLAVPTAAAESAPSHQRESVVQDTSLHVVEQLDWEGVQDAGYDGIVRFYAAEAASDLSVSLVQGAVVRPVSNLQQGSSGIEGYRLYRADVRNLQPSAPSDGSYTILVQYELSGSVAPLRTYYSIPSMTLFVRPASGQSPHSELFGEFRPAGYDSFHSARTSVPGNSTYTVSFTAASNAASSSDQTKWLWLGAGLAAGLLLAALGSRAGLMGGAKGKKFSKGGEMEATSMLEARRRTLLAALKELETAHESKQVPDDAYAPLKEEYKAQAVRVMRSLEEKKEG